MKHVLMVWGLLLASVVSWASEKYANLINYNSPNAQFADYYSRLGVYTIERGQKIGIGSGTFVSQRNGKVFVSEFLSVKVKELDNGHIHFEKKNEFKNKKVTTYPWGYVSTVDNGIFAVSIQTVFKSIDLIVSKVSVKNISGQEKKIQVLFNGKTIKDKEEKTVSYDAQQNLVMLSLYSKPPTPYPLIEEPDFTIYSGIRFLKTMHKQDVGKFISKKSKASYAYYKLHSPDLVLSSDQSWENEVFISAAQDTRSLVNKRLNNISAGYDESEARSKKRWVEKLDQFPDDVEEKYLNLLYKAAIILTKNSIVAQPEQNFGSTFGPYIGTFPSRYYYEALWVWDSAFQAMAIKHWDTELAKDNIRIMFHNQHESGHLFFLFPDSKVLQAQPPFFAWVALQIYAKDKDILFLKDMYPKFVKWMEWRIEKRDKNGNGLYEWADRLESGWDTSPRWDNNAMRLEATDINSFMIMDMKMLARMARIIGEDSDAQKWEKMALDLGKKVVEVLYDEEDGIFYDWNYKKQAFSKILTPACFLPLWAGVPLEKKKAQKMIQKYLLDKKHFYGDVPFPVVAYSEKTHDTHDYWRGPTWLNMAYFMIDVLHKQGFTREAEKSRIKMLDMINRGPYICEYYDTREGKGHGAKDFSWSSAFTIEMILNNFNIMP